MALLFCDGQTDLDALPSEKTGDTLRTFAEKGLVRFADTPGSLLPGQYYRHYDNRYIHDFYWSLTGRCNFRCRHCYINAPDAAMGEMNTEQALDLIGQMAECGVYHLILSGGEPLVRGDLWTLIDRIAEKGIRIDQVYTNGWLLTDACLDGFERRGLRPEFSVSFDGVGWHDWMRGIPGAESAALKALERCRDRGFSTNVEMCLHRGNADTIRDTLRVLAGAGAGGVKISEVSATELWLKNAGGNSMTTEEYFEAVFRYLPDYFRDGMPINALFGGVVQLWKDSTEYWPVAEFDKGTPDCLKRPICGAVRSSCYIAPDGRLLPCMPIAAVPEQGMFPMVQEIGLKAALKDSYLMEFATRRVCDLLEACKTCRECPHHLRCGGGCRATAVMGGERNLMGPDPTRCLMWKGGYLERLRGICDEAIKKYRGNKKEPSSAAKG